MVKFVPCQGKTACRDGKDGCKTCGRTTDEIVRLRNLLDQLCTLADEYDYINIDEYAGYIQKKLVKMISYRRKNQLSEQNAQAH